MSYKLAGVTWNDDGTMATKKPTPLEALDKIDNTVCLNHLIFGVDERDHCDCQSIEDFVDCYDTIEKALKALEFIKKRFTIQFCKSDLSGYYGIIQIGINPIYIKTQEEFDLLREVLL